MISVQINGTLVPVELDDAALAMIASAVSTSAQSLVSPLMTVRETAEFMRCTRQRVDDLLSAGRLTRIKDGRRTLLARDEIERYLRVPHARSGRHENLDVRKRRA